MRQKLNANIIFSEDEFVRRYTTKHASFSAKMSMKVVKMLSEAGFSAGRILDAGCGPGYEAIALKRAFPKSEVVGIDLSAPFLAIARQSAEENGLMNGLHFEMGDVENLLFEDKFFDVVINLFIWNVLADPVKMCNEIERVLKPDGRMIMIDLRRSWWLSLIEPAARRAYTISEVLNTVERTSLRSVHLQKTMIWWCLTA